MYSKYINVLSTHSIILLAWVFVYFRTKGIHENGFSSPAIPLTSAPGGMTKKSGAHNKDTAFSSERLLINPSSGKTLARR